ncbi:MAG: efflux RND transporter permease subunit [Myxococcota bacterium]
MSLPRFSIRQIVLVNLVFLVLIVAGLLAFARLPVDLFPDISFNHAVVTTVWPGASADEVERLVTTKLEDEIRGVQGIKEWFSFSTQGASELNIEWEESLSEIEQQASVNDLRAAIDRVSDLPEDAEEPILTELSVSEVYNVVMIAVTDVGGVGEYTLREVTRDLERKLKTLRGVRKATARGMRDRELRVFVDKHRALQYDLTLPEISDVIARNNRNVPGGTFTNEGTDEITVRGLGHFESAESLAQTVVRKNPDGNHVRLGDVADVRESFERRWVIGRYNGDPTIIIGISKDGDADVVDVVERVKEFVSAERLPAGVEASLTFDSSIYVDRMIDILRSNLLLGVVFVTLVLWFTVGFRNALLAIVGVPFSFLTAVILFPLFGITISTMALIGFIMVSGMLVDDAIIVIENIYRHVEAGEPLTQAVVRGTEEVMWPVVAAVATTMAAFLPMLLIGGTSGEFMSILPKTVIACLIASLVEALVVLPAHYVDFGSRRASGEAEEAPASTAISSWSRGVRGRVDGGIAGIREAYLRAQDRVLEHRGLFLACCLAALYGAMGLAQHVRVDLFPGGFNQLFVTVQTPVDYGIDQTNEVMLGVERALEPVAHELTDVSTYVGQAMTADEVPLFGPNYGVLFISFPDTLANIEDPERVLELVKRRLADEYWPDHTDEIENLLVMPPRNGPPIGRPVAIRIQADRYDTAKQIAAEVKAELRTLPGVYNVEDNVPLGPRELRVRLDEHRASIHGLTFQEVGAALLAANEGLVPSTFKDPDSDEDIDIRVMLRPEQRRTIADLVDLETRTPEGYLVKIEDVARVELDRGYARLYHYDSERAVVVYGAVDTNQTTSLAVNETIQARFADVDVRYPGVNMIYGGEFEATRDAFEDMQRAFIVAILAIFTILAAQFRSYTQPLVVMSVVGLSYIGVVLGMWIMDYAISMYVLYAIVGLAGIVVNDSLVLIDFVNQERARGAPVREAVRTASAHRFRPILLTTITTVAGLLPMAMGLQGGSIVFGPFASAIVFGLGVASALTLFVVPSLYLVLEDVETRLRRRKSGDAEPLELGAPGA